MNKNSKIVAILAVLFTVMVGLIPANIAWAGQLWQTLPTRAHTPNPTQLIQTLTATQFTATVPPSTKVVETTAAPQTATSVPASTATRTSSPGIYATITPSPATTATTNPNRTATVLVVKTELVKPGSTSAPIQTTAAPVTKSTNETPTNNPTETAQTVSETVPVVTNVKSSSNESENGTTLPVSVIFAGGFVLVIIIGAVLGRILAGNRKPE